MRLVLVGQPNCGKSTIFNAVAGYRAATANFPGTSVTFTSSRVLVDGEEIEVVDLPGLYSLTSQDEAEREAERYLLHEDAAALIDVVDASRLGRSLELTLQLLELRRPLVVALNMQDEAQRKGIEVDRAALERALGAAVVPTIARRGVGIADLFAAAMEAARRGAVPATPRYDNEVEAAAAAVEAQIEALSDETRERAAAAPNDETRGEVHRASDDRRGTSDETRGAPRLPARFAALRLLERDARAQAELREAAAPARAAAVEAAVLDLERRHGWPGEQVVSGARHALAHRIEERTTTQSKPQGAWREKLDLALMHPVFGIPILIALMGLFFWGVFGLGRFLEDPLVAGFGRLLDWIGQSVPLDSVVGIVVKGIVLGVSGGVAIVLPYLLPFLLGLAALEDTGYMPRMAYLLDGLMHRVGLHGKSIVPLILGYGCSVPAVMATRILENPRDRRITATLAVLVPCSARTTVILGLVGAVLGIGPALAVYAVNLIVIVALGVLLQRRMKGAPAGMVLEVPDLRPPSPRAMVAKTWLSLKEFVVVAWPALIGASIVLGWFEAAKLDGPINEFLAPLTTTVLGLPAAVGLTLVFGVLRKELALLMLVQALGTSALSGALAPAQMISFSLFIVFYVPCVATLGALWRELGWKDTAAISALCAAIAVGVAFLGRLAAAAIF